MEDLALFRSFMEKHIEGKVSAYFNKFWIKATEWLIIGLAIIVGINLSDQFDYPTAIYVSLVFMCISIYFWLLRIKKHEFTYSRSEEDFVGLSEFEINELGVKQERHNFRAFLCWTLIKRIVRANGLIMLFTDSNNAIIFPERKLEDPNAFYEYCVECNKKSVVDAKDAQHN